VFLPDHWHAICATVHPLTISLVMKPLKISSMILINRQRHAAGELWQLAAAFRAGASSRTPKRGTIACHSPLSACHSCGMAALHLLGFGA